MFKRDRLFIGSSFPNAKRFLYPLTNIDTVLLKIKRGYQSKHIYSAKLSENRKTNKIIIENYIKNKSGIRPELGIILDALEFYGFNRLLAKYGLIEAAKKINLEESKLEDYISQ